MPLAPLFQKIHNSPYIHLLKPRADSLALAIIVLGADIVGILEMTIVYPDGVPSYGDLWQGNIKRLGVDVRYIDIPDTLSTAIQDDGYENDDSVKAKMFDWVEQIWQDKDARITAMLAAFEDEL